MSPGTLAGVGITWYTPESWARMCAIADDRRNLTFTFEEFVANAEEMIAEFARQGIRAEKVLVDVDALLRWCRLEGYRVDKVGRAAYGAYQLSLRDLPAKGSA